MWRRTERASLEKKPSTRFSQEPCLGVKVNSNSLMMQPQSSGDGKERCIFAVTEQYMGSFNPGAGPSATAQSTSASPHPYR